MIFSSLLLLASLLLIAFSPKSSFFGVLDRAHPTHPEWSLIVDTTTNAFHSWSWDPLLVLLLGDTGVAGSWLLPLVHLGVFTIGTIFVLRHSFDSSWLRACIDAALSSVIVVALFGLHPVILGTLTWLPWCVLCCRPSWLLKQNSHLRPAIALFFILRLVRTAHQLSPLALGFTFLFAFSQSSKDTRHRSQVVFLSLFSVVAFALSLYQSFEVPLPPLPDYPIYSQVVPDDGVPGRVSPLLTSYAPLQLIDRSLVRYSLSLFALLGLLLSCLSYLFTNTAGVKRYARISTVLFIILYFDTYAAESWSIISPIQTVRRLLPGTFFLSLSPFILCASLLFLWWTLLRNRLLLKAFFFLLLWLINPFDHHSVAITAGKTLTPPLSIPEDSLERTWAVSPSYALYRQNGRKAITRARTTQLHFHKLGNLKPTLLASNHNAPKALHRMVDGRGKTRWSEHTGKQSGNEWVQISLPEPIVVEALDLNVGKFTSDFPRGIRITSWPTPCTTREPETAQIVVEKEKWLGTVGFSEKGFPYYKPQHQVIAVFSQPTKTQCLLLEQTGTANFDWSIARLRLARIFHQTSSRGE